jgi:hypothetical protein
MYGVVGSRGTDRSEAMVAALSAICRIRRRHQQGMLFRSTCSHLAWVTSLRRAPVSSRSKIALAATWFSSVSRDALGLLGGSETVDGGPREPWQGLLWDLRRHPAHSTFGRGCRRNAGSPGHDSWSRRLPPCREPNLPMEQQVRRRVRVRQRGLAILPPTGSQSINNGFTTTVYPMNCRQHLLD